MKTLNQTLFIAILICIFSTVVAFGQNVGIGTTNPDEELTVVGTIKSSLNSNLSTPQIEIHESDTDFGRINYTNTTGAQYFTLAGRPELDSTLARFHVYNSDFGNIGSFTGHGRLGVNASNPVAALHVNAQPDADLIRIQKNGSTRFRIFNNDAIVFGSNWLNPIPDVIRMTTPNLFVGFNDTHVPEERVEVDGNIKITGGIVADSVHGRPGQLLVTGSNGNIAWANPCSYNRFQGFPISGTVSWTVPVGVEEIFVEVWGAGGGGAEGGGGGAGGYVKAAYKTIPGQTLSIVTGKGGEGVINGAVQNASDGGNSSVTGTGISAAALGGEGGQFSSPGAGGLFSIQQPFLSGTAQLGKPGESNVTIPIYSGTSKTIFGKGGQSPFSADSYGKGDILIIQGAGGGNRFEGTSGTTPGGGGGGGGFFNNRGGDGYVLIRWNE